MRSRARRILLIATRHIGDVLLVTPLLRSLRRAYSKSRIAACGTPTVAIYGPTNPVKWGPWPAGRCLEQSPYTHRGSWQHHGNVLLLQGIAECVPCYQEGCERHKKSYSRCIDQLPPQRVIEGVESLVAAAVQSVA